MVTTRGATATGSASKKRSYKDVTQEDSSPVSSESEGSADEQKVPKGNTNSSISVFPPPPSKQQQSSSAPVTKKRPYLRTKRPAGYNDKSSITTTTETLFLAQPVNAYDAVLQESQDLLQAAAEAQQLGRLKLSSSYLLLLHTRLVGLGKRFDRATLATTVVPEPSPRGGAAPATTETTTVPRAQSSSASTNPRQHAAAAVALKRILPPALSASLEFDTAMMEHLARAAVELHAARTGSSSSHGNKQLLTSPTPQEFLAGTANQQGVTNAATVTGVAKAVAALEQQEAEYWNTSSTTSTTATTATAKTTTAKQPPSDPHKKNATEKFMPGRSKPATAAMRTVPQANCNAKALLHGAPFLEDHSGSGGVPPHPIKTSLLQWPVGNSISGDKDNDSNTNLIIATADTATTKSIRIPRADAAAGTSQLELSSPLEVGTAATGFTLLDGGGEESHQQQGSVMETADNDNASPVVQQTAEV